MDFQVSQGLQRHVERFVSDSGLPREIVGELIDHHTIVPYGRGSALFLRGSPADVLFWVFSGIVEVCSPLADGGRVLVRLCGPGDILGHVDFLDDKRRRVQKYEAHAQTKCEVGLITRESLFRLLEGLEPMQLIRLIEYINTLWSRADSLWAAFIGSDFRKRLELVLGDIALRLGVDDSRGTLLLPDLRHEQLAAMIGSSRPMITRLIDQMVQEGVLARQGKQYILLNRSTRTAHMAIKHHDARTAGGPREDHMALKQSDDLVHWLAARTGGGPRDDHERHPGSASPISATGRVDQLGKGPDLSSRWARDLPLARTVGKAEKNKFSRSISTARASGEGRL